MPALAALTARVPLGALVRYAAGLGVRGIETVGKLGLYVVAARLLGAHESGLFFLCLTWIGLSATMGRMGMDRAITRHIAAELAVGDTARARAALLGGVMWATVGAAGAATLTLALAGPAAARLFGMPDLAAPLALSALVILPQALAVMAGAALAGLKRGIVAQLVQNALWPVMTLGGLLAGATRIDHLLTVLGGALALSAVGGFAVIALDGRRRAGRADAPPAPPRLERPALEGLPHLWRTALPLLVVEVVQVGLSSIPVLALGMVADAGTVGAFSIANRVSMLAWVIIVSIGTLVSPQFAEHHRRGEFRQLHAVNRSARRVVALFGGVPVLLMMVMPETLLDAIGNGFGVAATALVIMAGGQLVNCLLSCQDVLLAMTGHGDVLRRLNLLQLLTCAVLVAALVPTLGMTGAAIVSAACVAQGAIGTTLAARRLLPREAA